MSNLITRRRDCLEALAAHNLALAHLMTTINEPDTLKLAESMDAMERTALDLAAYLHELLLLQRNVKTTNQRITEETGIDLSPAAIAKDQRLRSLFDAIITAKGKPGEQAARDIFAAFVKREYP